MKLCGWDGRLWFPAIGLARGRSPRMATVPLMQSSENTLFSHFKYGLLQFLAKIFGASAIALAPKLGLLGKIRHFISIPVALLMI
jgi:hypothetical protein